MRIILRLTDTTYYDPDSGFGYAVGETAMSYVGGIPGDFIPSVEISAMRGRMTFQRESAVALARFLEEVAIDRRTPKEG